MARRLFNFVTLLSLALSVGSAVMWVRSQIVTEAWEFKPRPIPGILGIRGQLVQSADGRLAWVEYDACYPVRSPPHRSGYLTGRDPFFPVFPIPSKSYPLMTRGQVGDGVAEWYLAPFSGVGRQRYIAVSWLALAFAGAILPVGVGWRRWRRRRRSSSLGFPVTGWVPRPPAPVSCSYP